jgi:hypothetical protein
MSLLSKILLFVNLVAAGGFAYLAVQDWQGRQTITAAGLRHIVLLHGLPLGDPADAATMTAPADPDAEIPFPVEMGGGVSTRTVGKKLLDAYFQQAGGAAAPAAGVALGTNQPVPSQLGEIRRVFDLIKAEVARQDGAKARANLLYNWLYFQPQTYDERAEILRLAADQNVGELEKRLYGRFEAVLAKPRVSAGGEAAADETERRARLAHLLAHLDRDPAWQKRVAMVVGLRRYVSTIGDQALRFRDMAARVDRMIRDDQEAFLAEYIQLRTLATERTQMVRDVAEAKARLQGQQAKDQEFVSQRQTQLMTLRTQLAAVKAEVDALLIRQGAIERQLFALQREVGLTLEEVYRLEAELRARQEAAAGKK